MIKKHKNKNEYFLSDNVFIRNFTKENVVSEDINSLYKSSDFDTLIENETRNKKYPQFELTYHPNVLIVSDGFDFNKLHKELFKLDSKVTVIAVNGALKKWSLVGKNCPNEQKKSINYYVANNPYEECNWFLPKEHAYYPRCIASSKTNFKFLEKYHGLKNIYYSAENKNYSGINTSGFPHIDDYRNPICAAIHLSYMFAAKKIVLLCCDDSFQHDAPGSLQLENKLYCYAQQIIGDKFIDGMCYWLKKQEIDVKNHSCGSKLNNAEYINFDNMFDFLKD